MFKIGEEEINAVTDTLRRGILSKFQGGSEGYLARAERDLAAKIEVKHALMMNSGTSALISALVALGIGPGDEVLISAYTWIATAIAPMVLGAIPKLVEIDESLLMDPLDLEKKITPQTKAIIVVHMANLPAPMDAIMEVAKRHQIPVVEDACQAVGGLYRNQRLGSIGCMGVFSFNNYKNITCGEGGALLTSDDLLFDRARCWHDAGVFVHKYDFAFQIPYFIGQNYRATEIDGALIFEQLKRLDPCMAILRERVAYAREKFVAAGFTLSPHHDPESAAAVSILFDSLAEKEKFTARTGMKSIFETAGKHIYTNWVPLVEKRTYREDINPLLTEEGKKVQYNEATAPRSLDILKRSAYVTP
ncbi:MAG: DegT/DnrJ/EryC1/StrS family aminotransferase, partial [Lentisphaeria bacterium]